MTELEELIFLKDFADRYHMGIKKARATMKKMPHHESPLFVTKSACKAWEETETITPKEMDSKTAKAYAQAARRSQIASRPKEKGKFLVPRERPEISA